MKENKLKLKCQGPISIFSVLGMWMVWIGLLVGAGCGYYSTTSGSLPSHIKTVAVPLFENEETRTLLYGVEEQLTDAVIERLTSQSSLQVVDPRISDSIVRGKIVEVHEEPYTYTADERAQQWKIRIVVAVTYEDVKKKKVRWEDKRLEGWGVYESVSEDPSERDTGVQAAIQMIADEIADRTVGAW